VPLPSKEDVILHYGDAAGQLFEVKVAYFFPIGARIGQPNVYPSLESIESTPNQESSIRRFLKMRDMYESLHNLYNRNQPREYEEVAKLEAKAYQAVASLLSIIQQPGQTARRWAFQLYELVCSKVRQMEHNTNNR
jgi:hypothetical protein